MKKSFTHRKHDSGFTLVELAIVMIIIGLLIGGVLKGQELITNAQVTSTVSQIKGYDSAIVTFRDAQGGLPGDLPAPTTRLPTCVNAPCNRAGNADGIISDAALLGGPQTVNSEGATAWAQLLSMNLITGIKQDANRQDFGVLTPEAKIGGGYFLSYTNAGFGILLNGPADMPAGQYLTLAGVSYLFPNGINGPLTTAKGARLDRKLDDGFPNAGNVRSGGLAACTSDATSTGTWAEDNTQVRCHAFVKILN